MTLMQQITNQSTLTETDKSATDVPKKAGYEVVKEIGGGLAVQKMIKAHLAKLGIDENHPNYKENLIATVDFIKYQITP